MPQGCSIITTLLFMITVALVFMFIAENNWFFEEILNFNVINSHQADPERVEKQKVLNQTSIMTFVVSVLYGIISYTCFVPSGKPKCQESKYKFSLFFLPVV